jgi:hypothetical protein
MGGNAADCGGGPGGDAWSSQANVSEADGKPTVALAGPSGRRQVLRRVPGGTRGSTSGTGHRRPSGPTRPGRLLRRQALCLEGASWVTAAKLISTELRNWYQAHYSCVCAKFRAFARLDGGRHRAAQPPSVAGRPQPVPITSARPSRKAPATVQERPASRRA